MKKVIIKTHVSTGYVNCDHEDEFIEEVPKDMTHEELDKLAQDYAIDMMHEKCQALGTYEEIEEE